VPLSTDALAALKAHRHLRTYVFDHEDGRPYTLSEWKNVVPKACAAAGVKRITMHGLRHSFGAHLVIRGKQLLVVKEALGHADYKTTLRYAHVGPSAIRDAVESLDGRAM
jgi:site-specific recombinase XerD